MDVLETARKNQEKAWKIIADTGVVGVWESIGAKVNLVGSLKSGLLMKNRDIDFHIYTDELRLTDSFTAMERLAENPFLKRIEYINLIDTEEECIEWHAWYEDGYGEVWQLDMIHLRCGSAYDGVVERVTEGVIKLLTPEKRETILRIKNDTPEDVKILGIEIYRAVLADDIDTFNDFIEWRKSHPLTGVFGWLP